MRPNAMAGGSHNPDTPEGITNYVGRHRQFSARTPATSSHHQPPPHHQPRDFVIPNSVCPTSPGTLAAWLPQVTLLSHRISSSWGFAPLRRLLCCPAAPFRGDSVPDSLLLSVGTRCRLVLQSPGPCALQSCNLWGRMLHLPAISGAACPPVLHLHRAIVALPPRIRLRGPPI